MQTNAFWGQKKSSKLKKFTKKVAELSFVTVASTVGIAILATPAVLLFLAINQVHKERTYKAAKKQLNILNKFKDTPDYSYANLKSDALDLYLDQTWGSATTSLESDYPIVWLESRARKNANYLQNTNNQEMIQLGKNLKNAIQNLLRSESFIKEMEEYRQKYRTQQIIKEIGRYADRLARRHLN